MFELIKGEQNVVKALLKDVEAVKAHLKVLESVKAHLKGMKTVPKSKTPRRTTPAVNLKSLSTFKPSEKQQTKTPKCLRFS
jgi:hypothetical protein